MPYTLPDRPTEPPPDRIVTVVIVMLALAAVAFYGIASALAPGVGP